jgi:hypothetical protein
LDIVHATFYRGKNAFFLIGTILICGCASQVGQIQSENWRTIRLGMTREQVVQALGEPRNISANNNTEVLEYYEDRGVFITRRTGIFKRYYIQLRNGKVEGYGPEDVFNPINAQPAATGPRSEASSRINVTRICEKGNEIRLKFFEMNIDFLKQQKSGPSAMVEIEELKQLWSGAIWLQHSLRTFTQYVLAGKPFAVTPEEIQQAFAESQSRHAFFAKKEDQLKLSQSSVAGSLEGVQETELLGFLEQHEIFLQRVLVAFSQEKASFDRRNAQLARNQSNDTFQNLMNIAIAAKLMQNEPANIVINKRK